jgi:hypothetical protein
MKKYASLVVFLVVTVAPASSGSYFQAIRNWATGASSCPNLI